MSEHLDSTPSENDDTRAQLETEFGWTIEGPFYTEVPTPNPELVENCAYSLTRLTNHLLKTVIINDGFEDHIDRRKFHTEHPETAVFNSKFSKLKGNNLFGCYSAMDDIIYKNRRRPRIHDRLLATAQLPFINTGFAGYNDMTFDEKVTFARKLDDIVFRFLSALA
ncbi:hypothetical protein ACFL2V_09405 [Pseudomonadota bacterium]